MVDYSVDDIVNLIVSGNKVDLMSAVSGVMTDKALDALEIEKIAVAQSMFNGPNEDDYSDDEDDHYYDQEDYSDEEETGE